MGRGRKRHGQKLQQELDGLYRGAGLERQTIREFYTGREARGMPAFSQWALNCSRPLILSGLLPAGLKWP